MFNDPANPGELVECCEISVALATPEIRQCVEKAGCASLSWAGHAPWVGVDEGITEASGRDASSSTWSDHAQLQSRSSRLETLETMSWPHSHALSCFRETQVHNRLEWVGNG